MVGKAIIRVWRGDCSCRLDCKIVDKSNIRPLLGRNACVGMKIVSYLDNDRMNKPNTAGSKVSAEGPLTKDRLVSKYPEVFGEGVGCLVGEYHILLNATPYSMPQD